MCPSAPLSPARRVYDRAALAFFKQGAVINVRPTAAALHRPLYSTPSGLLQTAEDRQGRGCGIAGCCKQHCYTKLVQTASCIHSIGSLACRMAHACTPLLTFSHPNLPEAAPTKTPADIQTTAADP